MRKLIVLLCLGLITGTASLYAQQEQSIDQQMRSLLKTEGYQFGVIMQSRIVFSLDDDGFNGGRKFDQGATRLDFRGRLDQNFTYRFQVDVRQQISFLDARLGYRFSPTTQIIVGADKPFTSLDLDPGPHQTDFINRARQVGAMMNTRELGMTLHGNHGAFSYRAGLYNGTALTRQNDDRFMYSLRLTYTLTPQEGSRLRIGTNSFINQTRGVNVGNSGLTTSSDRILFGLFTDYNSDTFFGAFEILQTSFEAVQLANRRETILGYYATVGYKLDAKNHLLARVDQLEYDLLDRSSSLVTLGWSHYPTRVIKLSVNALAQLNQNADNAAGVSAQFQFAF